MDLRETEAGPENQNCVHIWVRSLSILQESLELSVVSSCMAFRLGATSADFRCSNQPTQIKKNSFRNFKRTSGEAGYMKRDGAPQTKVAWKMAL